MEGGGSAVVRVCRNKKIIFHAALAIFFFSLTGGLFYMNNSGIPFGASKTYVRRHYRDWPSLESSTFHVRYPAGEGQTALWVAAQADRAALLAAKELPHRQSSGKPWLVIIPEQEFFRQVFGWGEGTGALGVYLAETVKVLSPDAWEWVDEKERSVVFTRQGPLVHEYTHYVLDIRTGGNYTRWFSEGLAQLLEYHILGYEWVEDGSPLNNPLYSLREMDSSFDRLPNQALAYRQAFSIVSYLEELQGMEGINALIDRLAVGVPFYLALHDVYREDKLTLVHNWGEWVCLNDRWTATKSRK
jgi:hypothetical protein